MKLKIKYLFYFLIVSVGSLYGQDNTPFSPFSKLSIGLLQSNSDAQLSGLSDTSIGLSSIHNVFLLNIKNPASYSKISLTSFQIGADFTNNSVDFDDSNASFNALSFKNIILGIPITRKSALVLGLVPYASKGYKYNQIQDIDGLQSERNFQGSGSLNNFVVGFGYQLSKAWSLGLNYAFIFGNLEDRSAFLLNNVPLSIPTIYLTNNQLNINKIDVGTQYEKEMKKDIKLSLGYVFSPRAIAKIQKTDIAYRQLNATSEFGRDTLSFQEQEANSSIGVEHKLGVGIEKKMNWLLALDVTVSSWDAFFLSQTEKVFSDAYKISLGGQWIPDYKSPLSYWKRVAYRLGFKYEKLNFTINQANVFQFGISTGIGLPLRSNRSSISMLDLSLEYLRRGNKVNSRVLENVFSFHLSFTIRDKWFRKPKYN